MASFEALGTLHEVFNEMQVTEQFRKREFVLEMANGMYTDYVKFQFTQNRCSALDGFKPGDRVKVTFNLSGRKTTARDGGTAYFTNLAAWKIEPSDAVGAAGGAPQRTGSMGAQDTPTPDDDDIPF